MTSSTLPTTPKREIRLDLLRGLALLVIFINHIPDNEGQYFTLSRYGWSDAAEVFVFCSGYVSALVFGRGFERSGVALGTIRILRRCIQIYAAHLAVFAAVAIACLMGNDLFPGFDYIRKLNIGYFFEQPKTALPALATLTYLPNGFDILPMYLVLLIWLPLFWLLSQISRQLAITVSVTLYLAAFLGMLDLSAEPFSNRSWFFNPFSWQLLFFSGYLLGAGWIRIELGQLRWVLVSLAVVLVAIPLAHEPSLRSREWLVSLNALLEPFNYKTDLGPLRLLHFAALGYLVATLLDRHRSWLESRTASALRVLGQHSLSIFSIGLLLSRIGGMVLDQLGHGWALLLAVNVGGMALLIGLAQLFEWLDGEPWRHPVSSRKPLRLDRLSSEPLSWNLFSGGVLRPIALSLLLLPLALAPFLMPRKPEKSLSSRELWLQAEARRPKTRMDWVNGSPSHSRRSTSQPYAIPDIDPMATRMEY